MENESLAPAYLQPGQIGTLRLKNRLVRAATSETMATDRGEVTDELIALYGRLAKGGAGLVITGHIYIHPRGQCSPRQMGIHGDEMVPGFRRLTDAVHSGGGLIFAELSHAGSQSMMPDRIPLAPSAITNPVYSRRPAEASNQEIEEVVSCFAEGARRASEAGFDGVHIHGGNGYLIAEFSSPHANRRTDGWGGNAGRRSRFAFTVTRAVRAAVGPGYPVTMRIGMADSVPGGLLVEESLSRAQVLADSGIDGFEVSYGIMRSYLENIRPYVAVSAKRAIRDWVVPRLWHPAGPQAYYRSFARQLKSRVNVPVILVGGVRSTDLMEEILRSGDADLLAMARPFIREPDFPLMLMQGRRGVPDCVSCNICLQHDGYDGLKCWRTGSLDLVEHAASRLKNAAVRAADRLWGSAAA